MLNRVITAGILLSYMAITMFGQALHIHSGCSHAQFASGHQHSHVSDHGHNHHDHANHGHSHSHDDHHHHHVEKKTAPESKKHGLHSHQLVELHDCALCQYLSQGQIAAPVDQTEVQLLSSSFTYATPSTYDVATLYSSASPRGPPVV